MVATTDIKYFIFDNYNIPQLTNDFGCMIRVLDACLINGIPLPQVSSLTVNQNIATLTFNTAHLLRQYQVIEISGANESEFNKQHRILSVTSNSLTFGIVTNLTQATGVLAAKMPSLGWEKPFSSTSATGGKGAYRSKNTLLPSRPFLRVVDELDSAYTATYAKFAKVGIVEDMTNIDTMLGVQAPYDSATPTKNWFGTGSGTTAINGWAKWYYSFFSNGAAESNPPKNSNKPWLLVGTKDYFYIVQGGGDNLETMSYGFGAFSPTLLNADNFCTFLAATLRNVPVNNSSGYFASDNAIGHSSSTARLLLQRGYGTSQYIAATTRTFTLSNTDLLSGSSNYSASKSVVNKVYLLPVIINETSNIIRGELPGIKYLNQQLPFADYQIFIEKNEIFIAKTCLALANTNGQIVFKVGEV